MNPEIDPNATPKTEAELNVQQSTGWIIAGSICLIVLGMLAMLMPALASAFFTAVMGWLALTSGVVMIVQSFRSHPVRGFWLNLIIGILYTLAGIYILTHLKAALLTLTLAFGWLFVVEGVYTIVMAFVNRAGHRMSGLVVLNGVITLILGILVLNQWPFSALWLIGVYVGVSLLFSGISLLTAALAARKAVSAQSLT